MITPADVALALGRPAPAEGTPAYQQWAMWIEDAQMLLRVGDGTHAGLGDLDLLDQASLKYVLREAVVAQVRRPDDATQVDIAVDDGRMSRTYQSSTGRVRIRDEWWSMLDRTSDAGSGAFSIRPSFASDRVC